jgi:hypothetical protein
MTTPDYVTGYLCVFRESPGGPWMPVGALRDQVSGGVAVPKERLVAFLLTCAGTDPDLASRAQRRRDIRKWAKAWGNIHDRTRTETYTDPRGREFGLLRCHLRAADSGERLADPHGSS